jgi:uncharacterized protein YcaQ
MISMNPFRTDRRTVRRFLLDTQHLLSQNEDTNGYSTLENVMKMIRKLECVQIDPIAAVERNQHLVLFSRIPGYEPGLLNQLLCQGKLFEYWANAACIIPMEDYPIFEPTRKRLQNNLQDELDKLGPVVKNVLERLEVEGPLPSRAFRSTQRVHGYWDNKQPKTKATSLALNLLLDVGTIRVVRREGSERFFDLTHKTVPMELLNKAKAMDETEASEALLEKYLRAYRVFELSDSRFGWQRMSALERRKAIMQRVENGTVVPLQIEDVRREYYILAEDLDRLQDHERTVREDLLPLGEPIRFLPPLDNLLWRRERIADFFNFTYKWEIYTPKEKRRYGYYAMPILAGDRLIGRIDPRLDREHNQLNICLLQIEPEVTLTPQLQENLSLALHSFAHIHGVDQISFSRNDIAR